MEQSHTLTVLGTADLHGHALDWDYHRDATYRDAWGNAVGLSRVASVVRRERAARHAPILLDAGDILQGTPLASYAAERAVSGQPHPMARAMNALGYTGAAVGNHEFDHGLGVLRSFERQLTFPLLAANVIDRDSGGPAFVPYVVREVAVPIGPPLRVGVVGLSHPGTPIWNHAQIGGTMAFEGIVDAAARWVPRVRAAGADAVIVIVHAGPGSVDADATERRHDGADEIAREVPGVDAVLAGHAHREVECQQITNAGSGEAAVLTMPMCWGMRVSAIDITVRRTGAAYRVVERSARLIDTADVEEDREILRLVEADHRAVVDAGRRIVGTSTEHLDGSDARWRPVPLVSLIQQVQAESVAGRVGSLPVLSAVPVPHYAAALSKGALTRRDIETVPAFAGLIVAVRLTGAEVRAHLETAARYFASPGSARSATARDLVNAETDIHPAGTPDFAFDSIVGHGAPLSYEIDLARPVGARIRALTYDGEPVTEAMEFAVAMSAFRRTGAHGYTEAADAPLLHEGDADVRTLLTDWVASNSPITPASFHRAGWRLTYDGAELDVEDDGVNV